MHSRTKTPSNQNTKMKDTTKKTSIFKKDEYRRGASHNFFFGTKQPPITRGGKSCSFFFSFCLVDAELPAITRGGQPDTVLDFSGDTAVCDYTR